MYYRILSIVSTFSIIFFGNNLEILAIIWIYYITVILFSRMACPNCRTDIPRSELRSNRMIIRQLKDARMLNTGAVIMLNNANTPSVQGIALGSESSVTNASGRPTIFQKHLANGLMWGADGVRERTKTSIFNYRRIRCAVCDKEFTIIEGDDCFCSANCRRGELE